MGECKKRGCTDIGFIDHGKHALDVNEKLATNGGMNTQG